MTDQFVERHNRSSTSRVDQQISKSITHPSKAPLKRSCPPETAHDSVDGSPTTVPKLANSMSVQQAWSIILSSGMSPEQLKLSQSQHTITTQVNDLTLPIKSSGPSQPTFAPESSRTQTRSRSSISHHRGGNPDSNESQASETINTPITPSAHVYRENGCASANPPFTEGYLQPYSFDGGSPKSVQMHKTMIQSAQITQQQSKSSTLAGSGPVAGDSLPSGMLQSAQHVPSPGSPRTAPDISYEDSKDITEVSGLPFSNTGGLHLQDDQGNCEECHEVALLNEKIRELQQKLTERDRPPKAKVVLPPRVFILHRVLCECGIDNRYIGDNVADFAPFLHQSSRFLGIGVRRSVFLDAPVRTIGDRRWHLQGQLNAPEETVFLEQNPNVVLLVYKDYVCKDDATKHSTQGRTQAHLPIDLDKTPPSESSQMMIIISSILAEALNWSMAEVGATGHRRPKIAIRSQFAAPYHFIYHSRISIGEHLSRMDATHRLHLKLCLEHVAVEFEESRAIANELFLRGCASFKTLPYLFEPNMLVVQEFEGDMIAYRTKCWLEHDSDETIKPGSWQLRCWTWIFDGSFLKTPTSFMLPWEGSNRDLIQITSLPVYPLKYAKSGQEDDLFSRGQKFWHCRKRVYVSYDREDLFGDPVQASVKRILKYSSAKSANFLKRGARYIVDVTTHKQMNPVSYAVKEVEEIIGLDSLVQIPPRDFFLLLPPQISGFSMQSKRWVSLNVAHTSPVAWNMEAFDSLVVNDDVKELVKALVTNQVAKEKGTDLMEGKGNGLVILLHGGPGTGKTLTAESVAELARKPLYRVTCGDIGTNADAIDKHLQKVLHLGRLWDCVVLLDEADVFLEERRVADMQRNALVSVFLRVLEYYDGILVLTSNRVGTFDEAFKSRIQLALHYENLTRIQRRKIWENFVKRLETVDGETVDTESLKEHLDTLAGHDMNGRQIRNSITTARQLAKYKERKMDYGLLKHAIDVASKFDKYLKNVKHNITDDEWARESEVR